MQKDLFLLYEGPNLALESHTISAKFLIVH